MLQSINLALRFLLEICALVSLSYWGFQTGKLSFIKWGLGIGAPVLVALIWGMFGSPAAPMRLSEGGRLVLELFINGAAVIALYFSGHPILAMLLILLVIINRILMLIWGQ